MLGVGQQLWRGQSLKNSGLALKEAGKAVALATQILVEEDAHLSSQLGIYVGNLILFTIIASVLAVKDSPLQRLANGVQVSLYFE